jgi:hypothetical protein
MDRKGRCLKTSASALLAVAALGAGPLSGATALPKDLSLPAVVPVAIYMPHKSDAFTHSSAPRRPAAPWKAASYHRWHERGSTP